MILNVLNRLLLLNMLPAEGDVTTLRLVRTLREDLSFSELEHAQLQLTTADGKITWQAENEVEKDFTFGAKATALVVDTLTKASADKKLTPQHLDLYDKFVE